MSVVKPAAVALAAVTLVMSLAALAEDVPAFTVDPAIASMTPEQKVHAREAAMKADGGALQKASKTMGADAVKEIDIALQNFTNFPALFTPDTQSIQSGALPVVWSDHDKFLAIFEQGKADLLALRAAAMGTDKAAYGAALKTVGGLCFECHQTYRQSDTN